MWCFSVMTAARCKDKKFLEMKFFLMIITDFVILASFYCLHFTIGKNRCFSTLMLVSVFLKLSIKCKENVDFVLNVKTKNVDFVLSFRTVDQTVHWLVHNVELPQYELDFRRHAVDGAKVRRSFWIFLKEMEILMFRHV